MSTTALHANVQRSRFAHHSFAAFVGLLPAALRASLRGLQPTPSASESASIEACEVRDMANSYVRTDPGFAADLYAAAARHEGLSEA